MHKQTKLVLLALVLIQVSIISASAKTDVAYILEDGTPLSGAILNDVNQLGLTYGVVRDSQIPSTDFSQYSILLVAEEVGNKNLIPFNEINSIFFDEKTAEQVWIGSEASVTTNSREAKVIVSSSEIFDGINVPLDGVVQVYTGSGSETHFLRIKPSYVTTLAIRTTGNLPVVATSIRTIGNNVVKDIFLGFVVPDEWTVNTNTMFKNSLLWLLEGVDQDGDGFVFGEDCNDNNNLIHPGATEIPYDNVDQDCSGYDLLDVDGDNYCKQGSIVTNSLIQCFKDTGVFGTDCDDNNATINKDNSNPQLNCVNDAPQIISAPVMLLTFEGQTLQFTVSATDPENDALVYSINNPDFVVVGNSYSWHTNFNDAGFYTFVITVSDSHLSATRNIQVQVVDENQPPTALNIPDITFQEESSYSLNLSEYFSDSDSDELVFDVEDVSEGLSVDFETNEIVKIISDKDFFGEGTVLFSASDGDSMTTSEAFISVTSVNDVVEFKGTIGDFSWNEDSDLENALNLKTYFSDVDSQLTFEVFENSNVNVEIINGLVSFHPAPDFFGTEEIYFRASDGEFSAVSNNLSLIVLNRGEPPVFENLSCVTTINEDEEYVCSLDASDFENDTLTFSVLSEDNLVCEVSENVLVYKSEKDYNGNASCTLKVSDVDGYGTIELNAEVLPVNDAPRIISSNPAEDVVRIIEGRDKTFSVKTEDVDSEAITSWLLNGEDIFNTTNSNSEFSFSDASVGNHNLMAVISDSEYSANKIWNIIVGPISDFTCTEAGGYVCSKDETCAGELLGVKDSGVCCSTACIPSFKDAGSCKTINSSLRVEIVNPESNDEMISGETLELELKVYNELNEDQNVDLEAHLYNLDKDRSEEDVNTEIEVKSDRTRTVKLDLVIPEDIEMDDEYALYVKASDDVCNQDYVFLKLERPENDIEITKFELPTSAQCGDVITAELRVENLGTEDQDVELFLESGDLNVDLESGAFSLESYDGEENRENKEFTILIPEEIEDGTYSLEATVSHGSEETKLVKDIEITCAGETAQGSNLPAQQITEKILLNKIDSVKQEVQAQPQYVQIGILMSFNLMLVAAGAVLYLSRRNAKVKKPGKTIIRVVNARGR